MRRPLRDWPSATFVLVPSGESFQITAGLGFKSEKYRFPSRSQVNPSAKPRPSTATSHFPSGTTDESEGSSAPNPTWHTNSTAPRQIISPRRALSMSSLLELLKLSFYRHVNHRWRKCNARINVRKGQLDVK